LYKIISILALVATIICLCMASPSILVYLCLKLWLGIPAPVPSWLSLNPGKTFSVADTVNCEVCCAQLLSVLFIHFWGMQLVIRFEHHNHRYLPVVLCTQVPINNNNGITSKTI
jgi:hypothetical protein